MQIHHGRVRFDPPLSDLMMPGVGLLPRPTGAGIIGSGRSAFEDPRPASAQGMGTLPAHMQQSYEGKPVISPRVGPEKIGHRLNVWWNDDEVFYPGTGERAAGGKGSKGRRVEGPGGAAPSTGAA